MIKRCGLAADGQATRRDTICLGPPWCDVDLRYPMVTAIS